ncbi:Eco57I restriction-modification methylase domain-containing protein [Halomonas saccharevitans]|uniref:site-specific DNA-methyltransferase (adenine-specific) n=1 Tax=Halomonas saccharevitans TaxID=416872 RepID=A0A1I7AY72_9GAMM|nr:type IIL restriction-modification enzyme MmeI [Halomonas saccharevitans]SFT79842.1 hypothetical protein SAMN04487956_1217 [Halomonas saccharevitans]
MSERHDWLNLIEVSGPFLSIPVLDEAFSGQSLEGLNKYVSSRIRQAYDEWREAVDVDDPSLNELHRAWVDEVLATALQMGDQDLRRGDQIGDVLHVLLSEHGLTFTPDVVLVNVNATDKPLLPMFVQPPNSPLDEVVHRDGWAASPAERMVHYLRGIGCPTGLVTNGERWMLVHAPAGQVTSFVSWYARLWSQEPETLRAFASLLAVPRFYGPEEAQLPSLFAKSEKHQDEVTEALGDQVRTAIEVLIQAIDKAYQDSNGKLLEGVTPQELYEGGLTVMMRLVFILSAEERGLLLLGNTTYDNHYALSTFRQRLRRVSSNAHELLERRHAGWSRLLALFRAIYGGIEHSDLRLPAMGGSLFDPDRYPFLEGRAKGSSWLTDAADPLRIDDRTVLRMLDAIQIYEGRTLSYRALDVEQIGHVYEGLLERTVRQIDEVTVELRASAQAKSPKVTLRELAEAGLDGQEALIELLRERTGRSVAALRTDLQRSRDDRLSAALLTACRGDVDLHDRVEPYVHLMALDPWDHPRLYHPGAYAVVMGNDRRETGTHYTPKSLTEKIVHETLTPVAYLGPAEGQPKEEWKLKSPAELLDLKVCDPAMGSGAFLVQACRWLGERLTEAWSQAEASGGLVSDDGEVLKSAEESELLPRDAEERTVIARRLVAERCLYGVDMNPLAVELAKLSIWLVTLAEGRPFGFLDHNLRCGDSLLGIHRLDQLTELSMQPTGKGQQQLFGKNIERAVYAAIELRQQLRAMPIRDIWDVESMSYLDADARRKLEVPELIADAFIGEIFALGSKGAALERALASLSIQAGQAVDGDRDAVSSIQQISVATLRDGFSNVKKGTHQPFHWPLEFPEVFVGERRGFDAIVANPPYIGGRLITGSFGRSYYTYLDSIREGRRGSPDLCVFFLLRAFSILASKGVVGKVVTATIKDTGNRAVGLDYLLRKDSSIFWAISQMPWPGSAALDVSIIVLQKGIWNGDRFLDKKIVPFISGGLDSNVDVDIYDLKCFRGERSDGYKLMGEEFVLSAQERESLVQSDPSVSDIIFPYFGGDDISDSVYLFPFRWAIDFEDRSEEESRRWRAAFSRIEEFVKPFREAQEGQIHQDCFWKYWDMRPGLRAAQSRMARYLVTASNSKYLVFRFYSGHAIFNQKTKVVFSDEDAVFAILQSTIHDIWARWRSGSRGAGSIAYSTSKALSTFPFPEYESGGALDEAGKEYCEFRQTAFDALSVGPTQLYNLFHNTGEANLHIEKLRTLRCKMDTAVAHAYGWSDLNLDHGFHEVEYLPESDRVRFTISENARIEVLRRLSELNRQRYEEEVAQGLLGSGERKSSSRSSRARYASSEERDQPQLDFESGPVSTKVDLAPSEKVLDFLHSREGSYAKSDILAATGLADSHWSPAIRDLIDRGLIERQGERRGARYRAVRHDS